MWVGAIVVGVLELVAAVVLIKKGIKYGATDDFGYKAVEKPVHPHDLHATILHLMGLDHTKLSYFYQGLDQRLTGVEGNRRVIDEVLA